ncbi:MAG: hypothetical protein CMP29_00450 [Roseibacillus sp.]|nr:hypothetical protein [Roseibacillus sp.]
MKFKYLPFLVMLSASAYGASLTVTNTEGPVATNSVVDNEGNAVDGGFAAIGNISDESALATLSSGAELASLFTLFDGAAGPITAAPFAGTFSVSSQGDVPLNVPNEFSGNPIYLVLANSGDLESSSAAAVVRLSDFPSSEPTVSTIYVNSENGDVLLGDFETFTLQPGPIEVENPALSLISMENFGAPDGDAGDNDGDDAGDNGGDDAGDNDGDDTGDNDGDDAGDNDGDDAGDNDGDDAGDNDGDDAGDNDDEGDDEDGRERCFGHGKLPEILQQFDLNEDGRIDEEERQAAKEARRQARAERRAALIEEWDTDGDGELSREERNAAREAAREERRAALQERREEMFADVAGEDECLDWDEFRDLKPFRRKPRWYVASIFRRVDTNDDDCISFEEFTSRLTRQGHGHRGHRRWSADRDRHHDDASRSRRRRWWSRRGR